MSDQIKPPMERPEVTRKGARRIAAIVDTGIEILLSDGFTGLTKRRIAKRLNISDGNVSYYFPTRESLWRGVIERQFSSYYDRHYTTFESPVDDAQGRFDEFVRFWFEEYRDREMRIFFSQLLAFAEVSPFVAGQRDKIYQSFFDETEIRLTELELGLSDEELRARVLLIMSVLEGLHSVSAFKPNIMNGDAAFQERVVSHVKAIAYDNR